MSYPAIWIYSAGGVDPHPQENLMIWDKDNSLLKNNDTPGRIDFLPSTARNKITEGGRKKNKKTAKQKKLVQKITNTFHSTVQHWVMFMWGDQIRDLWVDTPERQQGHCQNPPPHALHPARSSTASSCREQLMTDSIQCVSYTTDSDGARQERRLPPGEPPVRGDRKLSLSAAFSPNEPQQQWSVKPPSRTLTLGSHCGDINPPLIWVRWDKNLDRNGQLQTASYHCKTEWGWSPGRRKGFFLIWNVWLIMWTCLFV